MVVFLSLIEIFGRSDSSFSQDQNIFAFYLEVLQPGTLLKQCYFH